MDAEDIIVISGAVVTLTQLAKWAFIPDKWGPVSVLLLSIVGTVLWGWSEGTFERTQAFQYFAGWLSVSLNAAGVFGFTRAAATAVTKTTPPPHSGAGSSPTVEHDRRES